ncbi:hypothetical protein Drorol1_Dr00014899 [Drosera rotundifolia]
MVRPPKNYDSNAMTSKIFPLSGHNIQKLIVAAPLKPIMKLPGTVFTSKSLVVLELTLDALNVPATICLPKLRTLHLSIVKYPGHGSMQKLFSGCSSLRQPSFVKWWKRHCLSVLSQVVAITTIKTLRISYTMHFSRDRFSPVFIGSHSYQNKLSIDAPSLEYLHIEDDGRTLFLLKNLESVAKAYLDIYL